MEIVTPGRSYSALAFPFPAQGLDSASANQFLAAELAAHPELRGSMMIEPGMDPEFVRETVRRGGFAGLKCYHLFAATTPTFDAVVEAYLPEEHVRIAHELGLVITLHMVRARAIADVSTVFRNVPYFRSLEVSPLVLLVRSQSGFRGLCWSGALRGRRPSV